MDPKLVEIGINTFGIKSMDPWTAFEVLADLQKIILPVIGNLASAIDIDKTSVDSKKADSKDILEKDIDFSKIGPALALASNHLDGQTIVKLAKKLITKDLISVEFADGDQSKMDEAAISKAFTGNMGEMLQLIWKIIEVNYGDFFTLIPKDFGRALVRNLPKK